MSLHGPQWGSQSEGHMSFTTGLSATKAGVDLIKGALELLKRPDVDRSEIMARLLELQAWYWTPEAP